MELLIEKLISGGEGLSTWNGKKVFIPAVLPGELVDAEIISETAGFFRAQVVKILTPAPGRRKPPCPIAHSCGGCSWQHIDDKLQGELKAKIVQESFRRLGGMDIDLPLVTSGSSWSYRNRAQFHITPNRTLGFKAQGSPHVVEVKHCPVLVDPLNTFLDTWTPSTLGGEHLTRLSTFSDGAAVWSQQGEIQITLLGKILIFPLDGFFQSNLTLLPSLVTDVLSWADKGNTALDLYGGAGLFGVFLSDFYKKITVVEQHSQALSFARRNLGPAHEFYAGEVETWIKKSRTSPDLIVVDPPRTGLSEKVRGTLGTWKTPRILYVSCNPDTLARDAKHLVSLGFRLVSVKLYDFYPQTPHIEALGVFDRV